MKVLKGVRILAHTLLSYLLVTFVLVFVGIPALLLLIVLPARMSYDNRILFWLFDLLHKGVIGSLLVPVTIVGAKNMPEEPAIVAANHQSAIDIPFLGSLVNAHPHIWYALSYYARVPVLGFFIRRIGVPIDRENLTSAARSLINGIKLIQGQKRHIMIFPEGGRFNDGKVHDFLRGFAIIARKTGRPVVPVHMPHNGAVYPPGSFLIYSHPLKAIIGEPFTYREDDTDETFSKRVHDWFLSQDAS